MQMANLADQIAGSAANAVAMCDTRGGRALDYSESTLVLLEEMIEEASKYFNEMSTD